MSFEGDIAATLRTVCPRVFPDVAPAGTQRPYATYQLYGGYVINPVGNEPPGKRSAFVQVNVWSATRLEANNLIRQVEDAMRTTALFQAKPDSALRSTYEEDGPVYGAMQDYACWY